MFQVRSVRHLSGMQVRSGEVSTQCGHTSACKSRMLDAMLSDSDEKCRVQRRFTHDQRHASELDGRAHRLG